jgi:hypothetical protein
MPIRIALLALAAALAWPATAVAQTVIDGPGVYPPGVYRGPCELLDTHRDATPKVGDERRVKLVASLIRLGDATGPRLFKSAPPGCESGPLDPGEYAMQISTMETRWRYLCRYSNQSADDCTEIAKETLLDTLYTSGFAFTISERESERNDGGAASSAHEPVPRVGDGVAVGGGVGEPTLQRVDVSPEILERDGRRVEEDAGERPAPRE